MSLRTRASGSAAGGLGDLGHLVEELLLAGEQLVAATGRSAVASVAASTWASSSACKFLLGECGPVVVAADAVGDSRSNGSHRVGAARSFAGRFPLPLDRPAMDAQRAGERLDRGEQSLLQPGDQQAGGGLLAFASRRSSRCFAQLAVLVEQRGQAQLGGVGRQAVDVDLHDAALGEAALNLAEVLLEPADHDVVEHLLLRRARRGRTAAGRGSPAGPRSCSSGRCAAWPRGTADARTAGPGRGRPG